jgi:hypothetical protein
LKPTLGIFFWRHFLRHFFGAIFWRHFSLPFGADFGRHFFRENNFDEKFRFLGEARFTCTREFLEAKKRRLGLMFNHP